VGQISLSFCSLITLPVNPGLLMSELQFSPDESCVALIFDCDGTLVDSAQVHLAGYNAALAEYGKVMLWDWYSSRLGIPARDLLLIFAEEFGVALNIDQAMTIYANAFHENLALVSEVTLVAELARAYREKLPMAVASNGSSDHVIASLAKADLLPLFDVIVGREAVAHGKPAPDLYLEAARRLGVAPELCVVFEDSQEGMEAARRAGMKAYDVSFVVAAQRKLDPRNPSGHRY
jgi:HAD superfamily hydrolase (TIGR01509 family)